MTHFKIRRVLFWTTVLLFASTALILIPYSIGYRFSWQRGIFIYTGSVTIKSVPSTIDIFIDNQPINQRTINRTNQAYHVGGLKPGDHFIEVRAEGFIPWSKKITVTSGISTEFWNVMLARQNYSRTKHETSGIESFFYDSQKRMAAYTKEENGLFNVEIVNFETPSLETVFSSQEYAFAVENQENIEWAPKDPWIIIPVVKKADQRRNYFALNVTTQETINIGSLVPNQDLQHVRWDPNNRQYIYYLSNGGLFRLNLENGSDNKQLASAVAGYDLSSNKLYYFSSSDGIIYQTDIDSLKTDRITDLPLEKEVSGDCRIILYDEKRIALLDSKNNLFVYNQGEKQTTLRPIASEIKGIQFSDDGKKLLFWSDWEISALFLREWKVQPVRMEDEQRGIVRFSEPLSSVQWAKDYEHVIFVTGKNIKLTEVDHRDRLNTVDIITLNTSVTKVISDFPNNLLYFIDTAEKNPFLYSIEFPEKQTLF